ncbi:hypothetical protein SO802_013944 [Lithocarpus litseifolius]|uniref:Uncharacterized protein n=1 Tax=Lithocarpus litseifolius TaxID=425828 RepID=A0AAW2D9Q4_9ROSI
MNRIECECRCNGWLTATRHRQSGWIGPVLATGFCKVVRTAALGIVSFVGYLFKLALALVFHFIGDPITSIIRCIETALYAIRALHSAIAAYTPVPDLTTIILLASVVLAIVEVASPNFVNSQSHLLTVSGLIWYAAMCGYILEPFFWTLLLLLYGFSRFVKKKDNVSSALPVAAMLAAVGEP